MKYFLFILLSLLLIGCGVFKPKPRITIAKGNGYFNFSKKAKHYRCVQTLIKGDVKPLQANSICIDVFRKSF